MTVPAELVGMLAGVPVVGAREQAFPFITVDAEGFPHTALLSRTEMRVGPAGDLRAALRSTRTRANLGRSGHAALIAVEGRTAHYVKLRLVRSTVVHDLLACVLDVVEHKADSMGVALAPISYEVTAEIVRAERWDTTAEAFRLLS